MSLKFERIIARGLAVAFCASVVIAVDVNASVRYDLADGTKKMLYCFDGDPYIYANNNTHWNKSYDNSSATRNGDGQVPKGECRILVLDTNDEFPKDLPGFSIVKGKDAMRLRSIGWDILFGKSKLFPSKFKNPRPISSACNDQLGVIPMESIKEFCFK